MSAKKLLFLILVILISCASAAAKSYLLAAPNPISPTSPLPSYLSATDNTSVTSLSLWLPEKPPISSNPLGLTARSALAYDMTENKFLYSDNISQQMPMASLTKIMTAILTMEHPRQDDRYVVQPANIVGEDSMGLSAGEVLSKKELLYGLILNSGNDAAETLATDSPWGRNTFVDVMNQKAKSLGLSDTHFTNPTGLQGDGDQHTTAYDLLVMTHYALTGFPEFRDIAATTYINLDQTDTHKAYYIENETNLLTSYPGVKGVKTGYTPEAGMCLVTYLDYQGHKIIAVVLNSDDRRGEMKDLLDYVLKEEGVTPPRHG